MIQYIIYVISILGNKIITNNNNILYNTVSYSFYSIKFIYNYLSQNDSNNLQEFQKNVYCLRIERPKRKIVQRFYK